MIIDFRDLFFSFRVLKQKDSLRNTTITSFQYTYNLSEEKFYLHKIADSKTAGWILKYLNYGFIGIISTKFKSIPHRN